MMSTENGSEQSGNPAAAGGDAPWYSTIEDVELRGFAELKGFKDPTSVLSSYKNLEKHMGAPPDRILRIPEKADDPAWSEIKTKLGYAPPEKWEDYGLAAPEGAHPDYAAKAAQWAHKYGIPKDALLGMAQEQNAWVAEMSKHETESIKAQEEQDMQSLRTQWGQRYDASVELARRASRELAPTAGLDEAGLSKMEGALGTAAFLKFWAGLGSTVNQEATVHGQTLATGFGLTPEAASARFDQLKDNPEWIKKALTPGSMEAQELETLSLLRSKVQR